MTSQSRFSSRNFYLRSLPFLSLYFASDEEGRPKSHAEVMAEIIAKSKQHRHERAKEKAEMEKKTEELDQQFYEIAQSLHWKPNDRFDRSNKQEVLSDRLEKYTDYDKSFIELATAEKERASDRLKTAEEVSERSKLLRWRDSLTHDSVEVMCSRLIAPRRVLGSGKPKKILRSVRLLILELTQMVFRFAAPSVSF